MADTQSEPRLLLPRLRTFYDFAIPFSWVVIRFAIGWNLIVHAWGKINTGPAPNVLKGYADLGLDPPLPWYLASTSLELVGGMALIVGFFTRFFAAAVAIEMLIITMIYWKTGFARTRRGYEYTLMWGLVSFAIALRGGGPYSVDRAIGKEL